MIFEGCENYPLTHNLNVDVRHIGLESHLVPFVAHSSSQRMNMFSSNIVQACIIKGRQFPLIATGYEKEFMKYTYNPTRRDQDIKILAVIPKYIKGIGDYPIPTCNSYTVIYEGLTDRKINYFDIETFTKGADGFGYLNELTNIHKLVAEGPPVSKDVVFCTSKAVSGSRYMLGTNVNVAYMTIPEVSEDAFVISDDLANNRLEMDSIHTAKIKIPINAIPLNVYGDTEKYKICPDIDETVHEDGILLALRHLTDNSIITDTRPSALNKIQMHDDVIYAKPGATVLDIEVYINETRKIKTPAEIFKQPKSYWRNRLNYFRKVNDVYLDCKENNYSFTEDFISFITRCEQNILCYGDYIPGITKVGKPPQYAIKNDVIDHIYMIVTYGYKQKASLGYKLTGSDGSKGVVSAIKNSFICC